MSVQPVLPSNEIGVSYSRPLKVGDYTLKNRVVYAASTRNRGNVPSQRQVDYYTERASAGLIITEGALPQPQGYEFINAPGIYNRAQVAGWKKVVDSVHSKGGLIFLQVMHIGRVANPLWQGSEPPLGPSAIAARGGKFRMPTDKPATWVRPNGELVPVGESYVVPDAIEDFAALTEVYRNAFTNAKAAGFDGVELHGAGGYLICTFLDNTSNQRTDAYGGSAQKRSKFVLEIIDLAISIFGSSGKVGLKLQPEGGYNDMGMTHADILDTFTYFLAEVEKRKLAYVQISVWFQAFDPTKRATILPVNTWRSLYKGTLFLNGGLTPEEGSRLITSGSADAITFSRFFISNPDLPHRLINQLPLNGNFDWLNAFSSGNEGYLNLPTYESLSEEQRTKLAAEWSAVLESMKADRVKADELYKKQELDEGRVPKIHFA